MKKSIVMIACISSTFVHGMEQEKMSSFSTVFNGTTVNVKTGCIFEANNRVDLIIINKHHHKKLVDFVVDYYKDQPNPFLYPNKNQNVPANTEHDLIKKKSMIPQKFYYTMLIPSHPNSASTKMSAKKATDKITEYVTFTLTKSLIKIGREKKEKTIALTPLSSKSGFHKNHLISGTTTGIFQFIAEYPYAFDYIELIVENPRDIGIYADSFLRIQEYLMDTSSK